MASARWVIAATIAILQAGTASWLDQPVANWNRSGAALPGAPATSESRTALLARCQLAILDTPNARALTAAGWIPFLHLDRELSRGEVEVLGGMTGADGMCRPEAFNVFVFVGGRFAGTLSPAPMSSRADGSAGAVRLLADGMLSAEFARYTDRDALCCPSSRVAVRYRIDRQEAPLVVPVDRRQVR